MTGFVKSFNQADGSGLITPIQPRATFKSTYVWGSIYVHISDVENGVLKVGQKVQFDTVPTEADSPYDFRAVEVKPI